MRAAAKDNEVKTMNELYVYKQCVFKCSNQKLILHLHPVISLNSLLLSCVPYHSLSWPFLNWNPHYSLSCCHLFLRYSPSQNVVLASSSLTFVVFIDKTTPTLISHKPSLTVHIKRPYASASSLSFIYLSIFHSTIHLLSLQWVQHLLIHPSQ